MRLFTVLTDLLIQKRMFGSGTRRFIPQNTVATEDIKVSLLCRTSFASSIFSAACEVHLPATLDS